MPCLERTDNVVAAPFSIADPLQGADNIADLMVQKRLCFYMNMDFIIDAHDIQPVQCLDR